ncbi:MAG: DUF3800 domain-containing protein [Candidatus Pacebacteria bacterium]|nr:DUF3800 domain-containing protein [Candidatus Paceibacterota bacterium]MBP9780992.1 DUF3800 domain-containing protein [Candidatus Paceibacterota bacterium]
MGNLYNIYCDESCHLENDHQKHMVLGAIWCPKEKIREINSRIKEIKIRHNFNPVFEIKWTKVSTVKKEFYLDLIDYFFDNDDLHFRIVVIKDKNKLNHIQYKQTHDVFYYKTYFNMLKVILSPDSKYNIYLDIKDTKGGSKVKELHNILSNSMYDFDNKIIKKTQIIRSNETGIMQLTDLLIGAISYSQRSERKSEAKKILIKRIEERSGYSLEKSTLVREEKFNIFFWEPSFYSPE